MPEECPSAAEMEKYSAADSERLSKKTKACTNRTFRRVECTMPVARDYQEICVQICEDEEDEEDEEESDSDGTMMDSGRRRKN